MSPSTSLEKPTFCDPGTTRPRGLTYGARFFVPLCGFWAILILNLSGYWSTIPQYSFGWLVPALTLFLIFARWRDRPAQSAPAYKTAVALIIALSAVMVLPTWVLEQPNADWRLVSWSLAIEVFILTSGLIYLEFGYGTLLHFLPPLLFFLTCVPWPFDLEWFVIQGLTRFVVGVAIDVLNLIGIGAIQHGTLIEVGNGTLDVTEACSGIRSLQSSFMISIFLGEFYRLSVLKRIGLIAIGMTVAVVSNVTRAWFLVYMAARNGMASSASWHDPAGVTILVICFVSVWLAALALTRNDAGRPARPAPALNPQISWRLSGALVLWFFAIICATEVWYRDHEREPLVTWHFRWPEELPAYQVHPVSPICEEILHYDAAKSADWRAADGTRRAAYLLRWNPGESRSRIPSRSHRPEICLANSGYTLRSDLGILEFPAGDIDIPFEHYLFEVDGMPANIFFCVWQDHPPSDNRNIDTYWSRYAGFLFALHGQRTISQQVLEYGMFGPLSPEEASRKFRAEMGSLIVR